MEKKTTRYVVGNEISYLTAMTRAMTVRTMMIMDCRILQIHLVMVRGVDRCC